MNDKELMETGLKMMAEAKAKEDAAPDFQPESTAAQVEGVKEKDDKKQELEYILCPCCGKQTLIKPVDIKGALLDHYMACILSGVPFWREYPIYHGNMLVSVSQLTMEQAEAIEIASSTLSKLIPDASLELRPKWTYLSNTLKLYISITSIKIKSKDGEYTTFSPQNATLEACEILRPLTRDLASGKLTAEQVTLEIDNAYKIMTDQKVVSSTPSQLLMSLVESHNYIYNLLLSSGFDLNFWDGIELA